MPRGLCWYCPTQVLCGCVLEGRCWGETPCDASGCHWGFWCLQRSLPQPSVPDPSRSPVCWPCTYSSAGTCCFLQSCKSLNHTERAQRAAPLRSFPFYYYYYYLCYYQLNEWMNEFVYYQWGKCSVPAAACKEEINNIEDFCEKKIKPPYLRCCTCTAWPFPGVGLLHIVIWNSWVRQASFTAEKQWQRAKQNHSNEINYWSNLHNLIQKQKDWKERVQMEDRKWFKVTEGDNNWRIFQMFVASAEG